MGILFDKGIAKRNKAKSIAIFENLFPNEDFMSISYNTPKDFVNKYWSKFQSIDNWFLRSRILELIVYSILFRESVVPLYINSKLVSVPNIKYSCVAFTKNVPICLFINTNPYRNIKKLDLKATAVKYVYPGAKCYILSYNFTKKVNFDFEGIDKIIDCKSDNFNDFVSKMKRLSCSSF